MSFSWLTLRSVSEGQDSWKEAWFYIFHVKTQGLYLWTVFFGSLSFQDTFLQLAAVGQAFRAAMMLSGSPNQNKMSTPQICSRLGDVLGVGDHAINRA